MLRPVYRVVILAVESQIPSARISGMDEQGSFFSAQRSNHPFLHQDRYAKGRDDCYITFKDVIFLSSRFLGPTTKLVKNPCMPVGSLESLQCCVHAASFSPIRSSGKLKHRLSSEPITHEVICDAHILLWV